MFQVLFVFALFTCALFYCAWDELPVYRSEFKWPDLPLPVMPCSVTLPLDLEKMIIGVSHWHSRECEISVAPNGTDILPRDLVHAYIAPFLHLNPRVSWTITPCGMHQVVLLERYAGRWHRLVGGKPDSCINGSIKRAKGRIFATCNRCYAPTIVAHLDFDE